MYVVEVHAISHKLTVPFLFFSR